MREVLSGRLWTGNAHEARDIELVCQAGIRAVVDLAIEEPPAVLPRELAYLRCPIDDSPSAARDLLRTAIATASTLVSEKTPTLVACSAGLSRSPSVAAVAVSLSTGQPFTEVLKELGEQGPTDISPGLLAIISSVYQEMAG